MKKRTIIDICLIFLLLILLIFLGTRDYSSKNQDKDSKRFDKDYSLVSNDNVFKYVDEEKVYEILKSDNGIIFMGFKENEWSNYYAKLLNEAAKDSNIQEIYYYDFLADREKKSVMYNKIIDYLSNYLKKDDLGNVNIVAPSLVIIKDGVIIYYDDETSITSANIKPEDYWELDNTNNKLENLKNILNIYLGGENGGEE